MSVVTIDRDLNGTGLAAESAGSDRMPGGIALSATLHVGLGLLILLGLPTLFTRPPPEEMPIAVQLVNMGPETRATHPNPQMPVPDAKPIPPPPTPPAPVPPPKPEPPQPSAEPPPSAASPPPPPPEPPKPEVKPEPTPPPPPPKPEVKPDPTPPPPPPPKPQAQAPPPPPMPPPRPPEAKPKPPEPKNQQVAFDQLLKQLDKPEKQDQPRFDSLLKNLTKNDSTRSQEAPPQRTRMASATAAPSSQPRAPLGAQLSASEMDMVREQISRCWNIPAGARDAKDLSVDIRVQVDPDGNVRQATIASQGRMGDPFYRAAAESAVRAFYNPQCRPLKLPPDKYAIWKDMTVTFSPKDML